MKKVYTDEKLNAMSDEKMSSIIEENFSTYENWDEMEQQDFLFWAECNGYEFESETEAIQQVSEDGYMLSTKELLKKQIEDALNKMSNETIRNIVNELFNQLVWAKIYEKAFWSYEDGADKDETLKQAMIEQLFDDAGLGKLEEVINQYPNY